jgi:hypothetical protein
MKIQVGEVKMSEVTEQAIIIVPYDQTEGEQSILPSKTSKYLLPCLKQYGRIFTNYLNKVYKVAAGIGDTIIINRKEDVKHEKHVYILLDGKAPTFNSTLHDFLAWIRDQTYYVDDYVYGDIQKSNFHMVIIQFPVEHHHAFDNFKAGKYSLMYRKDDLEKFFANHPNTVKILTKDHNYRVKFTRKVNKLYNLIGQHAIKPEEWDGELDFDPTDETEIFNHHLKRNYDTRTD